LPGHIFDANVLRNFLLTGTLALLPKICSGKLYLEEIVYEQLARGKLVYRRVHVKHPDDPHHLYPERFEALDAALKQCGFIKLSLAQSRNAAEQAYLACLVDEDAMDAGDIECLVLAACRGFTLYSDDLGLCREVQVLNAGNSPCPRYGTGAPPHLPVEIHSTAWLLLEGIRHGHLSQTVAEALWREMQSLARLPTETLMQLAAGRGRYW
jgi:hypothetical protein